MATKILWTDETWNPIVGCSKVSPGCANCYAEKMALRLANMLSPGTQQYNFGNDGVVQGMSGEKMGWSGKTAFVESALSKPLHWRSPRKIFVCSMGDLFHESVPFEWVDKIFAVMALCPQHTFQVLTKRPERMKEYLTEYDDSGAGAVWRIENTLTDIKKLSGIKRDIKYIDDLPLPNVWLGVTAENQEMADKRIPILLQTPAALRFVSVEPMLRAVDLTKIEYEGRKHDCLAISSHRIDWVIVGAESGAGRRKCKYAWYSHLVVQCQQAGVPVFVKQLHAVGDGVKLIKDPAGWPREFPAVCNL